MTEHDSKRLTRRDFLECSVGVAVSVGMFPACSSSDGTASAMNGVGGAAGNSGGGSLTASGGAGATTTTARGGANLAGGSVGIGGSTNTSIGSSNSGGSSQGGRTSVLEGGSPGAGGSSLGGTSSGGTISAGGQANAGGTSSTATGARGGTVSSGGTSSAGNAARGGTATAGGTSSAGGAAKGGTATSGGNSSAGGATTGGKAGTGGSATGAAPNTGGQSNTGGATPNPTGGTTATGGTVATGGTTGTGGTALVGIVRHADVATAVANAVAIAGGMPDLTGKTVLLKPNVVCTNPSPYATSSAVVAALINMAKSRGAKRIIVADRSDPGWSTADAFRAAGITTVASQLGAELIDLNSGTFTTLSPKGATNWGQGIAYSDIVRTGIDYLVNVPCCKHHLMAYYTAAIKNWMGIISQDGSDGRLWAHDALGSRLPELHLAVREHLVVMDATKICLSNGPFGLGDEASPGIVVASTDPVAVDVVAISLLKHYLKVGGLTNSDIDPYTPWTQPQIVRALQVGIGITSKSAFNYLAQGVSEIGTIMNYAV